MSVASQLMWLMPFECIRSPADQRWIRQVTVSHAAPCLAYGVMELLNNCFSVVGICERERILGLPGTFRIPGPGHASWMWDLRALFWRETTTKIAQHLKGRKRRWFEQDETIMKKKNTWFGSVRIVHTSAYERLTWSCLYCWSGSCTNRCTVAYSTHLDWKGRNTHDEGKSTPHKC